MSRNSLIDLETAVIVLPRITLRANMFCLIGLIRTTTMGGRGTVDKREREPGHLIDPRLVAASAVASYSEMTWSAHSTMETKMAGLPNLAPQVARSLSETPRAREQAPQEKTGMCLATILSRSSLSGGQPMGSTASAVALRMR
jgi:hypothetical protein